MADPLFYSSRADLAKALRLSKVCPDSDTDELLDQFIIGVRAELWSCFGDTRITSVLGTAYTEAPSTAPEYERAQFADLEWAMVLHKVVLYTNVANVDGGRMAFNDFDAAAPYLIPGINQQQQLADRIYKDVSAKREALGGCVASDKLNDGGIVTAVTSNPNKPTRGGSVYRNRRI